jgi:hypothetical protein
MRQTSSTTALHIGEYNDEWKLAKFILGKERNG